MPLRLFHLLIGAVDALPGRLTSTKSLGEHPSKENAGLPVPRTYDFSFPYGQRGRHAKARILSNG